MHRSLSNTSTIINHHHIRSQTFHHRAIALPCKVHEYVVFSSSNQHTQAVNERE